MAVAEVTRLDIPPQDLDAEQSLLGAMLLSRDATAAAVEACEGRDFHRPNHGLIFDAICRLYAAGDVIDVVTVADTLRRQGTYEQVGGEAALVSLQANAGRTTGAETFARIIREHSTLRDLSEAGRKIADMGYEIGDFEATIDRAEATLTAVTTRGRSRRPAIELGPSLSDWMAQVTAANEAQSVPGVATGLVDLDEIVGGLRPGQLVTIAGRPGMAKTATACQLSLNVAAKGARVLFVSLEMSLNDLQDRFMAIASGIDLARVRDPRKLAPKDFEHLIRGQERLDSLPVTITDDPGSTVMSIRSAARRTRGLGLIVVDYLQLMSTNRKVENRQVEVAEMSRGLKKAALDLRVPILALAQLNRGVETRADKRPMLADLRESGAIENDSDIVGFLYREDYYRPGCDTAGQLEVHVAKNRNGPTGTATLFYDAATGRIKNRTRTF